MDTHQGKHLSDNQDQSLYRAAEAGDVVITEALLKGGVPPDRYRSPEDLTALHTAAKQGHVSVVQTLLEHGAEVDLRSESLRTALHFACDKGHVDIVSALLEKGSDLEKATKDNYTPLCIACKKGHIEIVKLLLSAGADVHHCLDTGNQPLHIAARAGHVNIVRTLLEAWAEVDARNKRGYTALIEACYLGHLDVVKELIPTLEECSLRGSTPLYVACCEGHPEIVDFLLSVGANIHVKHKFGHTPLIVASMFGHFDIVRKLASKGGSVTEVDAYGYTAVHWAALHGHLKAVRVLVEEYDGIQCLCMDRFEGGTPLELADSQGHTAVSDYLKQLQATRAEECATYSLFAACQVGDEKDVERLLSIGADVNRQQKDGSTPLIVAAEMGHHKIVEALLKANAKTDVKRNDGDSALSVATERGFSDTVRVILLMSGARMDLQMERELSLLRRGKVEGYTTQYLTEESPEGLCQRGDTLLHRASQKGNVNEVLMLLMAGADVEARATDGSTPLCLACQQGNLEVVRELIKFGANPNAQKKDGATPLCIVSKKASSQLDKFRESEDVYTPIVWELLEAGADTNIPDNEGKPPLYLAIWKGNLSIVQHLLDAGAKKEVKTSTGETLLHIASMEGRVEMIDLLLKNGGLDIDAKCGEGNSPLHLASERGHTDVVDELLRKKANPDIQNDKGWTSLILAAQMNHIDVVESLLRSKCNIDSATHSGETALHMASTKGYKDIYELLLQYGATNLHTDKEEDKFKGHISKLYISNFEPISSATYMLNEEGDEQCNIMALCDENVKCILDLFDTTICALNLNLLFENNPPYGFLGQRQMDPNPLVKVDDDKESLFAVETRDANGDTILYGLYIQKESPRWDKESSAVFIYSQQTDCFYVAVGKKKYRYTAKGKLEKKENPQNFLKSNVPLFTKHDPCECLQDFPVLPMFVCREDMYFDGCSANQSCSAKSKNAKSDRRSNGYRYFDMVTRGVGMLEGNKQSTCIIYENPVESMSHHLMISLVRDLQRKCKVSQVVLTVTPKTMDNIKDYCNILDKHSACTE